MSLKIQAKNNTKGSMSMHNYFVKMENICDGLVTVGYKVLEDDMVLYILVGLLVEYDVLATLVTNKA